MHKVKNLSGSRDMRLKNSMLIMLLLLTVNSFSQDKKPLPPKDQPAVINSGTESLTQTRSNDLSGEELRIIEQINLLKKSGDANSAGKISELQKQYEEISRNTVTVNSVNSNSNSVFRKVSNRYEDNITKTEIYTGGRYFVALATQTEQRGPTAGKIWVIVAAAQADTGVAASGDSLLLYSSDDNGQTFSLITSVEAATAVKINRDELDLEIIENTSGTKYLYVTAGYTTGGYTGDKKIALLIFDDAGNFSEAGIAIPGYSASSDYFRPRITSDNSTYPSLAYVTVAFMQDSISGPDHNLMPKFFRIYNPYTLTPAITYFPLSLFTPVASASNDFRTQADIAYFNNISDSLIFVISAYPGFNSNVYLYKAAGNANVYPNFSNVLGSTYAGDEIENARVASNGGSNIKNLMISYSDNYLNSGDWDQWIYSSQDASAWTSTVIEFSGSYKSHSGDIAGKRNTDGSFNIAFKNVLLCRDMIASAEIRTNSIQSYVPVVNDNFAGSLSNPKPAFRYADNDSALTFWGDYYVLNATGGSNAIKVQIIAALEGTYDQNTFSHVREDYITFYLKSSAPPYNTIDSTSLYMYTCFLTNMVIFKNAPDGNYYIAVKHRNTIETWSSAPVSLTNGISWSSYNFTSSSANSYGNNVVQKGSVWCFYTGDVNQDGIIDATDVSEVDNDAYASLSGSINTDLNGDYFVDASDLGIVDNNAYNAVTAITP